MASGKEYSEVANVQGHGLDSFAHGRGTVAAAGTAVALTSGVVIRAGDFTGTDSLDIFQSVTVKADFANVGNLFVGGSAVSSANGFILEPGSSVNLPLRDLADIFIDAVNNGDDFVFFAVL